MIRGIPIGRLAGIPLRLDWTLLVIFGLLTWNLAAVVFPEVTPGYAPGAYWATAAITTAAFFASLLAHELSHSLVARRAGMQVDGITLWLFGGVATLRGEIPSASDDFKIAVVGPLTSFAVALVAGFVAVVLGALGASDLAVTAAAWLSLINVVLAVFNLAPAAPLDGGRILRAALWRRRGDRISAAVSAARAGQVFAYALMGLGLLEMFGGGGIGGLWLVFLGWFVLMAAQQEEAAFTVQHALEGVTVRDVMTPDPVVAPADVTVDDLLERYVLGHRCSAFPLVDASGHTVGLLTLTGIKRVPPAVRASTRARDVMRPISEITAATPDEPLTTVLERLGDDGRVLVFDADRLVGIITPTDITRVLQVASLRSESTATDAEP